MAAPSFVDASTGNTDAASPGVASTSGFTASVGDVFILQVLQDGTSAGISADFSGTGWEDLAGTDGQATFIGTFDVGSPASALQHLWIGRVTTPSASGNDIGLSGFASEDIYCRIYSFSGVNTGTTLSEVIENGSAGATVNGAGTSGTIADADVTTLGADRLALNFVAGNDDNAIDAFTGMSGGTWAEAVAEYAEASGTDGVIQLQTATIASAGTIGGGTDGWADAADSWGVVGFALIPESGFTTHNGSAALPISFSAATAGFKTTTSAVALPLTFGAQTAGFKTTTSTASLPLTFGVVTAGARTLFGSSALPLTFGVNSAAIVEAFSSAALPITFSATSSAKIEAFSSSALPITFVVGTAGFKTTTSSVTLPISFVAATAGARASFGAVALPIAFNATTAGFKTTASSADLPLTFVVFTDGTVEGQQAAALLRTLLGVGL